MQYTVTKRMDATRLSLTAVEAGLIDTERRLVTTAGLRLIVRYVVVEVQTAEVDADVTQAAGEVLVLHLEVGRQHGNAPELERSG